MILRRSIVRDFAHFLKSGLGLKGSRQDTETGLRPSERASKIIRIDLRDHSFDGLGPEISWVNGCPGMDSGGWGALAPPGDLEESASHHALSDGNNPMSVS